MGADFAKKNMLKQRARARWQLEEKCTSASWLNMVLRNAQLKACMGPYLSVLDEDANEQWVAARRVRGLARHVGWRRAQDRDRQRCWW
jgi:hypothetical protein